MRREPSDHREQSGGNKPPGPVLAEITADLHLDQFERAAAGIGEAVGAFDRDVDRFILVHAAHLDADHHLGGSLDYKPRRLRLSLANGF
jgi:hypothetical protein